MKAYQLRAIVNTLAAPCQDKRKVIELARAIREYVATEAGRVRKAIALAKEFNADNQLLATLEGFLKKATRSNKASVNVSFVKPTIPFHYTTGIAKVVSQTGSLLFEGYFQIYFRAPTYMNKCNIEDVYEVNFGSKGEELSTERLAALQGVVGKKFCHYWDALRLPAIARKRVA